MCSYTTADALLLNFRIYFKDRWWAGAVTVVYNVANIGLAVGSYWMVRCARKTVGQGRVMYCEDGGE